MKREAPVKPYEFVLGTDKEAEILNMYDDELNIPNFDWSF